jgi:hypothetical protein
MIEGDPNIVESIEGDEEIIPTPEKIQSVFEQLVEGKEYKEERRLEDEKGVYIWEITVDVSEEDGGGHDEYGYMRKGHYDNGEISETDIHITRYDDEGMPRGGDLVAKLSGEDWEVATLTEGEWKF